MLVIPGTTIHWAARAVESRETRYAEAWCGERLLPGTVLNVGRCAPLFRLPGLGYQAEFRDGPLPMALRTP